MEPARNAVALGLFDGVHLGHRAVLEKACAQSRKGFVPAVFTFKPESAVYKTGGSPDYIYGAEIKKRLLNECGIKRVMSPDFDEIKDMDGRKFAGSILKGCLNAGYVCCGRDFRFGSRASCGVDELMTYGKLFGFRVEVAEDVLSGGIVVSSSEIRRLLREGSIERANELLGRSYSITGIVTEGNHIGRTIEFPTVNQEFGCGQLVPAYGAYASAAEIDGEIYRAVTNIGVKPTISGERAPLAETHILGWSGDLYGKTLEVQLKRFIREEQRFASLDELKSRIAEDVKIALADI